MRILEIDAAGIRRWQQRWPSHGFPNPVDGYRLSFDDHHRSAGAFILAGDTVDEDRLPDLDRRAVDAMESDAVEAAGLDVDWGLHPDPNGVDRLRGHVSVRSASELAGRP